MKLRIQKGFTLVESMIVVAIIGLLAAIGIAMYNDYMTRIQVTEGFVLSSSVRTQMMEYHGEHGQWPNNNNLASLQNQNNLEGQFVKSMAINKHRLEIQYGEGANKSIWGKKIQLVPSVENGMFTWSCETKGNGVDEKYLPEFCN